jgi:dihydropteroate synthase
LTTATQVRATLAAVGVDPAGIERMVGKAQWLNIAIDKMACPAANIVKQEMLTIGADAAVARGTVACSREHTSVVLMGSLKHFSQLIKRLPRQPFGLAGLAQEIETLLVKYTNVPQLLYGKECCLSLDRPQVMGVVNVTPDSFYDGGSSYSVDTALEQARKQVEQGADILDIGGESTRPGAPAVSAAVEMERIIPVIRAIRQNFTLPISIDTNKAVVAAEAIAYGANFVNDISGLTFDSQLASVVANSGAGLFVMHTRGYPEVMQLDTSYDNLLAEVVAGLHWSVQTAIDAGIAADKLAVDPGIGFGKSVAGNLELVQRLAELRCLGCPILLGTSRKSFIGAVLSQDEPQQRLYGSLATVVLGIANGAQLVRVHDVAPTRQVVDMAWAVCHS